jgi:hypothetical protein
MVGARAMIVIAMMLAGVPVSAQPRPAKPAAKTAPKPRAVRPATLSSKSNHVAADFSFCDLKLIGIVSQGAMRKALLMDPGNRGHIVKPGDHLGRERVLVREITRTGIGTTGAAALCGNDIPLFPSPPAPPSPPPNMAMKATALVSSV